MAVLFIVLSGPHYVRAIVGMRFALSPRFSCLTRPVVGLTSLIKSAWTHFASD